MPRTWPSIRLRRFTQDALLSFCMIAIYPLWVLSASPGKTIAMAAQHPPATQEKKSPGSHQPGSVRDPVCGMTTNPNTRHRYEFKGQYYHFCSAGCRAKFTADPRKYLAGLQASKTEAPEGTIYTCPMHPQIRQVGPGSCPICGMALEPEGVSAQPARKPEIVDMTRRFWVG